mgnify:CR=1 FL=1
MLDADGNPKLDADGKPIAITAPAGGTNPVFGVDGSPVVHDALIEGYDALGNETGKQWRTILFVPYGRGGAGFSVLDITNPIILHSWTGGNKWTKKFIELGVYFSISGIVTYDTAHDLQAAVKNIPIDKILLETDVPYLAPQPFKGKRNNPTYINILEQS